MAWSLSVSALQSMHFLVSGLVNLMTGHRKHTLLLQFHVHLTRALLSLRFPFHPLPHRFLSYFINYKQKTQQKPPATRATYNFSSIIFITSDNTLKLLKEK